MLVPWKFWINLGGFIFMEPLLFIALDLLMDIFGWRNFTSPWLDDCVFFLGGLLTCFFLVDHPLVEIL
jgi:hypothetical protein